MADGHHIECLCHDNFLASDEKHCACDIIGKIKKENLMADELRCPKCRHDETIYIDCIVRRVLRDGKLDITPIIDWGNNGWGKTSLCMCPNPACGHEATVADFRQKPVKQMLLEACEAVDGQYLPQLRESGDSVLRVVREAIQAYNERGLDG